MAITHIQDRSNSIPMADKWEHYPIGGRIFNLTAALLSLWIVAGLYLDGSAHHHIPEMIETFFTSWHAVLYSGFFASAAMLLLTQWRNVSKGYKWAYALPKGYMTSLVGALIFMFSGGGDFLWHTAFGFEVGLEALVSPTHLGLAVGGVLIISGPLRAALYRSSRQTVRGWEDLLPTVLSLLGILSVLTFFTGDYTIVTYPYLVIARPVVENTWVYDLQVLAGVLIPAAILMGMLLFALRHWTLPLGSLTLIIVGNGLLMTWFHLKEVYPHPQVLIAVLVAGLAADVLYWRLQPSSHRVWALRLFAFLLPTILFASYFVILLTTTGIWWSVHLWTGSVFLAGVIGLLLSFLIHPSSDLKSTSLSGAT